MVYFITGPICSGKSSRLLSIYNSVHCGDGFYNIRRYADNKYAGQDLVQMSTGISMPFSRVEGCIPEDWHETACLYNYSFSLEGLAFAESIADNIMKRHKAAFLDELGPLELKGQGLFSCFKKLYTANIDIFAVCRDSCVSSILKTFGIDNYRILDRESAAPLIQ